MRATKEEIRTRLISQRISLEKDTVELAGNTITRAFIEAKLLTDIRNILCYIATGNEVETKLLIDNLQSLDKNVYVPAFDYDRKVYVFARFNGWGNLVLGPYGVKQPADSGEIESIDLAILPGVAFDTKGYRLGYGKGVYDRLLAGSPALRVGFAYDFQIVDRLPAEKHDLKMDFIITEKRILRVKS